MLTFWRSLRDVLSQGHPAFLALVVENTRHSPGTQGAKMWIASEGRQAGTIGGGRMEMRLIQEAREALASGSFGAHFEILVHQKTTRGRPSGMICAGKQTNLYLLCDPLRDRLAIEEVIHRLETDQPGRFVITPEGLQVKDEAAPDLRAPAITFSASAATSASASVFEPTPDQPDGASSPDGGGEGSDGGNKGPQTWRYEEELLSRKRIAICGGGHCGYALSQTMKILGYHTLVFDVRPELPSFRNNPWADRCITVERYEDVGALIPWPSITHAVVMTSDCPSDHRALRGLLPLPFPFLGVMGASAKIAKIRHDLQEDGFSPSLLERLTAPVGLPIHSHTPEEIAISIAAQILSLRPTLFPVSPEG